MIDPIQVYLIIPRSLELIIYTICVFLIYNKQKLKESGDPGNYIRSIYIFAFISWIVYMILDIIISLVIALSITPQYISSIPFSNFPIIFRGYFSKFPSVTVANILRDFQMLAAISMIILTFMAAQIIKYGKSLAIKRMKDIRRIFFFVLAGLLIVIFDMKEVEFKDPSSMNVTGSWDSLGVVGYLGFILYVGIITYSTGIIFFLYIKNSKNMEKHAKKKIIGI